MPSNLNDSFWKWFNGSRVVNRDGSPLVMYHGHVGPAFSSFDPAKIKAVDTDAPFNGFWFSADHNTSPAFRDAHGIMPVYLAIRNPAPWQVWRKVAKEVMQDHRENKLSERSRSVNDEVRYRLADMGHDGILFSHSPDIDAEELERTGRTEFRSVRGSRHSLRKETRPEMVWGDTTDTHTYPEAEVIRKDGTREPLKMDLTSVATLVASTPGADVKDFNFSTLEGTIVLPNGDRIESKLVTKDFPTKDWIHTGRDVEEIGYYDGNEHIISYADLQEFVASHDIVWVCFHPNQIKSIYNQGTWSNASPNISEGLRGWIDLVSEPRSGK